MEDKIEIKEEESEDKIPTFIELYIRLKEYAELELEELADCHDDFAVGEKYAWVICLELMQKFRGAKKLGLDYDIEERFPPK